MRRPALIAALIWTAGFLALYLVILHAQGGIGPAWWFVAFLCVAIAVIAVAVTGVGGEKLPMVATLMLAMATLVGLMTIGLLLAPAVVATALAAAWSQPRPAEGTGGPA